MGIDGTTTANSSSNKDDLAAALQERSATQCGLKIHAWFLLPGRGLLRQDHTWRVTPVAKEKYAATHSYNRDRYLPLDPKRTIRIQAWFLQPGRAPFQPQIRMVDPPRMLSGPPLLTADMTEDRTRSTCVTAPSNQWPLIYSQYLHS